MRAPAHSTLLVLGLVWLLVSGMSAGQSTPVPIPLAAPLPDAATFLEATRVNLTRAQQEQDRYSYKERRTELHVNPFGRMGTGGERVYEVTPGPDRSVFYRRLIERDGKAVEDSASERQERRSRTQAKSVVDDTVANLELKMDRREVVGGRAAIAILFGPRPGPKPATREGKLVSVFKGTIWVDEAAHEVMRIEAVAIDNITYGYGLLARLNKGTRITVVREPIEGGVWLPTSIRFVGEGRAMLVRKLSIDYSINWFDYKRVAVGCDPQNKNKVGVYPPVSE
jgi:hypothetical protein